MKSLNEKDEISYKEEQERLQEEADFLRKKEKEDKLLEERK